MSVERTSGRVSRNQCRVKQDKTFVLLDTRTPLDTSLDTRHSSLVVESRYLTEEPAMSATTEKPSNKYVVNFHSMEKKPTIGKTSTGEGRVLQRRSDLLRARHQEEGHGLQAALSPGRDFQLRVEGRFESLSWTGRSSWCRPALFLFHIPANMVHTAVATDRRRRHLSRLARPGRRKSRQADYHRGTEPLTGDADADAVKK